MKFKKVEKKKNLLKSKIDVFFMNEFDFFVLFWPLFLYKNH